jgi:hypothetical protein
MSYVIPLTRRLPLTLADIGNDEERVIIYCLNCGRSRDMLVYLLRKMVGPISLGTANGRFGCRGKGGCGKAVGMVLPKIAPTPEIWARYYKPKASDPGVRLDAPPNDFPFHVERWTETPDTRECTVAQVATIEMANAAFDLAIPGRDLKRGPYILIRHQGRVLRDSRRNFKVVKTDKEAD